MLAFALSLILGAAQVDLLVKPGSAGKTCKWAPFDGKPGHEPGVYVIPGGPYGMTGVIEGITVPNVPTERKLHFSLRLRASRPEQSYSFSVVGFNLKSKQWPPWTCEWEREGPLVPGKWRDVGIDIRLPKDTQSLRIVIHNPNRQSIDMGSPSLMVGRHAPADLAAVALAKKDIAAFQADRLKPSPAQVAADQLGKLKGLLVAHVRLRAPVRTKAPGETGIVTFPVPGAIPGQAPLAFRVICESPGKLLGYKWRKRDDGRNYVCDVTVMPGTKGSWVDIDTVAVLDSDSDQVVPSEGWNNSTACVQSSAPEIQAIARRLSKPGETSEAYARKVFAFVRDDAGKGKPFVALDALSALQCGGSCTNKANLAAALLRAHGLTARTVSHMPLWAGILYEHWLTEYWQDGKGWISMDPSLGRWEPDRRTRVVLSIANSSDEDKAFDPLHERFVMPGAPYLSVAEFSPTLYAADLTETDAINTVELVGRFASPGTLFDQARSSFDPLFAKLATGSVDQGRYDAVLAAVKTGKVDTLLAAIGMH